MSLLVVNLRYELLEMLDRAAPSHSGMDRVAAAAQAVILQLQVKPAVEIECGAILVKLRPYSGSIRKDEIDLLGTRHQGAPERGDGDALGSLMLLPFDLRHQRTRLYRYPQDYFVLDDEASNGLPDDSRLRSKNAEQERHEAEDRPRNHLQPAAITRRFAAAR